MVITFFENVGVIQYVKLSKTFLLVSINCKAKKLISMP